MIKYLLAGIFLASLCFTIHDAQGALFLKIDSIPGDSTVSGHENQIEISGLQFGEENNPVVSAATVESGKTTFDDMQITKFMDRSSTSLVNDLVTGKSIPTVELFLTKTVNGHEFTYNHITLNNVMISRYVVSSGGNTPSEIISFQYGKISTAFTLQNPDGSLGQTITSCWDISIQGPCIDTSIPTVSGTVNMTANANGWYNHTLSIAWTGNDPVDGISTCDPPTIYSGPDAKGANEIGHCTDNFGNVGTGSVLINYDATPPTITGGPTVPANSYGWYNTTVIVHFTASDSMSGVASVTPDTTVSTEGTNQQVAGTATDYAGNSASYTVSGINIDKTPPVTTGTLSRLPDHNGWYNHPVAIQWSGTDNLSGIASCDPNTSYTGPDGPLISLSGSCLDKAGNRGSSTVTFKYDITPPTLVVSDNMTVFPTNPNGATVSYPKANATDDEPSSALCTPSSGSQFGFGQDIVSCIATDDAGNNAAKSFWITVLTPAQATQKLTSIINGMSLPGGQANSFDSKLAAVLSSINSDDNKTATNQLNAFINEVNAQAGKKISSSEASQLLLDAQDISNSLLVSKK
ncbi:MAG: type VI secretion system tube protein Hcp [Thaumarchaeota archaeon]|nr:type VI secretion system tube protein Hcp [Nitrososphaerota archaeon]